MCLKCNHFTLKRIAVSGAVLFNAHFQLLSSSSKWIILLWLRTYVAELTTLRMHRCVESSWFWTEGCFLCAVGDAREISIGCGRKSPALRVCVIQYDRRYGLLKTLCLHLVISCFEVIVDFFNLKSSLVKTQWIREV